MVIRSRTCACGEIRLRLHRVQRQIGRASADRSGVSPCSASIFRTRSRWKTSPEWLAAASASRSPERSSPARSTAAACIGLLEERGKTGASGSPRVQLHTAVRGQHDQGAPVVALDEAGPYDLGENGKGGGGRRGTPGI